MKNERIRISAKNLGQDHIPACIFPYPVGKYNLFDK